MIKVRQWIMIVTGLVALGANPAITRGQMGGTVSPNLDGFTVAGKGSVAAKPNRLEIDLQISASSEMTADVIVKYRDAKKRLSEAFATLKLPDVSVEERALTVDQKGQAYNPYMMEMPAAKRGKVEVQLTRKLVVQCGNIRAMDEEALLQLVGKLLDVAQDAGAKVGQPGDPNSYYYYRYGNNSNGLIRFILDDFDALQDQAYQAAIDDARKRAGRLARLSGVELGPVAGVREVVVPGEKGQSSVNMYYEPPVTEEETPKKQIEAAKFQEIPVKVELLVRFATGAPKGLTREVGQ